MFDFLKKLFGKNEKVEPERVEPLKEQPVVTPEPKDEEELVKAVQQEDLKADISKEEKLVSTKDEDVTVEDFESPVKDEPEKEEPKEDEPVYDIKTHSRGWQVILPGAQRATRVLDTQKQAIEYCKENNYQYKVHKK
jgi:hypothetical protein